MTHPTKHNPHIVDTIQGKCQNCGMSAVDCLMGEAVCDPTSKEAKLHRQKQRDAMVGRITGNST